ncbi:uncharacterized protein LOC143039523 [Oratosquilla oratoria]|uniref:uncharacterized protein LOC143039523 n=1 Tax=Oratosquilla oratoria TaxID=337810 RepID=UPI003F763BA8
MQLWTATATILAILASARGQSTCPTGYTHVEGYCFKVPTDYLDTLHNVTYDKARDLCLADAGSVWKTDLVMLKSTEKLEALGKYIICDITHHTLPFEFWAGAERIQNTWKWIDGTEVNLQSHIWLPGSPPTGGTDLRMLLRPIKYTPVRVYATVQQKGTAAPSYVCEATRN